MASLVGHNQTVEMIQTLVSCLEVFHIVIRLENVTEQPGTHPKEAHVLLRRIYKQHICEQILKTTIAWDIFWMAWFLFEWNLHSL